MMTKSLKDFLIQKAIHCKSRKEQATILHLWFGDYSNINDKSIYIFFDETQFVD